MKTILLLSVFVLTTCLVVPARPDEKPLPAKPGEVLQGLREFYRKTALPDGSFRPGIDPSYQGMSDSAYSDLAPVAYAVILHRTFGWKWPDEERTRQWLLNRQQPDGARHEPWPVLAKVMEDDYKGLPAYSTSFFPLAY